MRTYSPMLQLLAKFEYWMFLTRVVADAVSLVLKCEHSFHQKMRGFERCQCDYRGFARRPCWMARTMKMFCIRMNICSHRNTNLLFLPFKMAAVQNLYTGNQRAFPCSHVGHAGFSSFIFNRINFRPSQFHAPLAVHKWSFACFQLQISQFVASNVGFLAVNTRNTENFSDYGTQWYSIYQKRRYKSSFKMEKLTFSYWRPTWISTGIHDMYPGRGLAFATFRLRLLSGEVLHSQ